MDGPPPPPPPHGANPGTTHGEYRKASDLPEGHYDIFVIPPHSSGSGFIYLPSLQCHRNSFIAGSVSTLLVVMAWWSLEPIAKGWFSTNIASGGFGVILLIVAVGFLGWLWGTTQAESGSSHSFPRGGPGPGPGGFGSGGPTSGSGPSQSSGTGTHYSNGPNQGTYPGGQNFNGQFPGGTPNPGAQYSGKQHNTGPEPANDHSEWEKAREETRKKEEYQRWKDAAKKRREEQLKEQQKKREREAKEREERERKERLEKEIAAAREAALKEAREKMEREAAEARARAEKEAAEAKAKTEREAAEAKAKAEREAAEAKAKAEREAAEAKARAEREAAEVERKAAEAKARAERLAAVKEAAAKEAAKKVADAKFAAMKEAAAKKVAEQMAKEKEAAAKKATPSTPSTPARESPTKTAPKTSTPSSAPRTPSPKKPPHPTVKTATEIEDDAYSFRPYDRPRRPYAASSVYSESSYAPSQSTARTTPPPSVRGAYSTKDPDKIVIRGVYAFNNTYMKTPIAKLVSGTGQVTDGLILRITTEGLFIDDDVRGVPEREWDVKAWTMKLVEVWCPQFGVNSSNPQNPSKSKPFHRSAARTIPTSEESDAFLANLLKVCKNTCRLASASACFSHKGSHVDPMDSAQSSQMLGYHVVRASIRDQDGKKYVFVLEETEGWKVAIGLQRLRRGSQVRALGVAGLPPNETKAILDNLQYV